MTFPHLDGTNTGRVPDGGDWSFELGAQNFSVDQPLPRNPFINYFRQIFQNVAIDLSASNLNVAVEISHSALGDTLWSLEIYVNGVLESSTTVVPGDTGRIETVVVDVSAHAGTTVPVIIRLAHAALPITFTEDYESAGGWPGT